MASDAQLYLNYTKLGGRRVSTQRFAEIGVAARQVRSQKASQVRSKFLPMNRAEYTCGLFRFYFA